MQQEKGAVGSVNTHNVGIGGLGHPCRSNVHTSYGCLLVLLQHITTALRLLVRAAYFMNILPVAGLAPGSPNKPTPEHSSPPG